MRCKIDCEIMHKYTYNIDNIMCKHRDYFYKSITYFFLNWKSNSGPHAYKAGAVPLSY